MDLEEKPEAEASGDEREDDSSSDVLSEEEEELESQVADVPFEVLQKARAEGHVRVPRDKTKMELKRANKNRPMEISSKKPVGRFRDVVQTSKRVIRDPRFESLCGNFDEDRFKRSYSFLYNENLPAEREALYKSLKKEKNPQLISEVKNQITAIEKKLKAEKDRKQQAEREAELKKKERELVKQGKKPYYMKKSDKRRTALIEKYKELKSAGKLEAFLAKRRKKNAAKDHRYMPYRRAQPE